MIFLNSITLGLFDYTDRESKTFYNRTLDRVNMGFTIVYAVEAVLKIIAYGFFKHKRAYLREYWNIIDFTVAIIGYEYSCFNKLVEYLKFLYQDLQAPKS
jgi:hypothetical protein